tara:strand:- start:2723 stop:2920 length:198 start_codon:yes stop_codon:yes gene_type:complete
VLPQIGLNAVIEKERKKRANMGSKQSVFIILGLAVLIGGIVFLSRAIEPPRQTEVEVLDNSAFQR